MKRNITATMRLSIFLMTALISLLFSFACNRSVTPATDDSGTMNFYFGNIHSHTGLSDGEGTPDEAFSWARDAAKYDFYINTDHGEYLFQEQWDSIGESADAFNEDGAFTAIRGFEYSEPLTGHACVYNTDSFTGAVLMPIFTTFYTWLDQINGLAVFNHPGDFGDFNKLQYYEKVADNFFGIETGNGSDANNDGTYLDYYTLALDNGWRVAPVSNQDNHSFSTNSHRTVMVCENLTRDDIYGAMAARRVYSSDDPNMKIVFKANDEWMGSEINVSENSVAFTVTVTDDEPITKMELVTGEGVVASEISFIDNNGSAEWVPTVAVNGSTYFFLKVYETNQLDADDPGDVQIAVTAPIWITVSGM